MAEAYGKLTGRPGVCLVTRGPGATHAQRRRAHRVAGLDADDPARGPGRARRRRPRGLPGARLRPVFGPMAKWVAQIDDAGADPGARRPRVRGRELRAARARSCSRCRRTCSPTQVDVADAPPHRPSPRTPPGAAAMARLGELLDGAERPLAIVGEGGWTARPARTSRRSPRRSGARRRVVPLPGLRRQRLARVRGPRRARHGPGARAADPRGRPAAGDRRAPRRDHDRAATPSRRRRRRSASSTSIPTRTSWGPCTSRSSASPAISRRSRPRARGSRRDGAARGGLVEAAHAEYERNLRRGRRAARRAADVGA